MGSLGQRKVQIEALGHWTGFEDTRCIGCISNGDDF